MSESFDFREVFLNLDLLARGAKLTVLLWSFAFGLGVGLLLGCARMSRARWLSWPAMAYVEIFRNTPVLVQLVWFYYAFPVLTGLQMAAFTAAALASRSTRRPIAPRSGAAASPASRAASGKPVAPSAWAGGC